MSANKPQTIQHATSPARGSSPLPDGPDATASDEADAPTFVQTLLQTWPLLLGCGVLNVGNGLQSTLLGVRAGLEGYPGIVIGLLMGAFYLGFIVGAYWTPQAVRAVGGIRVFAALASVASVAILIHAVFVDPIVWIGVRMLTGFCIAGMVIVAESWLNQSTDNRGRGQLLAAYMLISFAGLAGGQAMISVASPMLPTLFMAASVLISVAAVPLLLTATRTPTVIENETVSFRRLYRVSPLGTVGTFIAGIINGSLIGMGAVYTQALGFSVTEISVFMTVVVLGGALMQWPIGRVSDLIDRRAAIVFVSLGAALCAVIAMMTQSTLPVAFIVAMTLFGGFGLSTLALCIAHTNDYLEPTELVGASSGLVLLMALGSALGPFVVGAILEPFGPISYPVWLATISCALGAFTLWRMLQRRSLPAEEQGPYVAVAQTTSAVAVQVAEEFHSDEVQAESDADELASRARRLDDSVGD